LQAKLRFSKARGNAKLMHWHKMYTYSMRAGHDCPFAKACKSCVVVENGKATIKDGRYNQFRCWGASCEIRSKNLRDMSQGNSDLVRKTGVRKRRALADLLDRSIPQDAEIIRVHTSGGDFLSKAYLQAWMDVAEQYPDVLFYGYTKALPYYVQLMDMFPENLRLTPSRGGTHDHLIDEYGLHEARVVYHPDEAEELGWPIDHDDKYAMEASQSFCLLIHGVQPKGSMAAAALAMLRKLGIKFGYSRGSQSRPE